MRTLLQHREHAGSLLSGKLEAYKGINAVVIGISHGGVCVAAVIAEVLSLPLEVISCRMIKHPADNNIIIGSVSENDAIIHESSHTIPQDYIYHQIVLLRNSIQYERKFYYGDSKPTPLLYKAVILVDDVLRSTDSILVCLGEIKRQKPLKVIVAVPVVSAEAARVVRPEVDDMVYLRMEPVILSARDHFREFPKVDNTKVKELIKATKHRVHLHA